MLAKNAPTATTIITDSPARIVKKTRVEEPDVKLEPPQMVYTKKKIIFRFYQVIWYVLGIVEFLLAFRIILKAIGANPFNGFTAFIYATSDPFALPFQGILRIYISGGSVIEWSTLIAMAVYALIAWGIVNLLQFIKPVTPDEVEQKVDEGV